MVNDYITYKKTFYNLNSYILVGNSHYTISQKPGAYEIYQGHFIKGSQILKIIDSLGVLFVYESIFENCFSADDQIIKVNCISFEFDIIISKFCVYNCSGKATPMFSNMTCSSDSLVFLEDWSVTICSDLAFAVLYSTEEFRTSELIGHNVSHVETFRHAGPSLCSHINILKFLTLTNCKTLDGIFVFLDRGNSVASHSILTNNTVIASLYHYGCVFTNNVVYIKESYIVNNPVSFSISAFQAGSYNAVNCVCDNISTLPNAHFVLTSFPKPNLRHLRLGKCMAQNPLGYQFSQRCILSSSAMLYTAFLLFEVNILY